MDLVLILLLALLIDLVIGEYPASLHLTVWAGRMAGLLIKPGFKLPAGVQFLYGILISLAIIVLFALVGWQLLEWMRGINYWLYIATGAVLLKPAFCLKQQWQVAEETRAVLEDGVPVPSRMKGLFDTVSHRHCVTRNDIICSSVRSIAENASDFVTAPLFYYLFLGVPGAIVYRVTNTLDNMIGYRGKYEYLGKFAAVLDDVASFIPSRITAFIFVAAASLKRLDSKRAWRTMVSDHNKTPSSNGGWPMAAAAGALGVKLFKTGHYEIGHAIRNLTPGSISEAVGMYRVSMVIWILVSALILVSISLVGE